MNNTVNYQTVTTPGSISLRRGKIRIGEIASKFTISNINASQIVAFLFAMFLISAVTLCSLSAQIYQLNNEVAALQAEYESILTVNDELEGKIMAQCSLGEVESYASSVLGMRKATQEDYEYIRYATPSANENIQQDSEGGFVSAILEKLGF
ncbi:MAG: hypothetical protein E7218_02685 [Anaerofustis stercorihominis]|nr:hypothetical protein [Anaerofustis stercorihominis]